jgi:hypothetical protein
LFAYPGNGGALATAAHVVDEAATWEEPVRLENRATKKSLFLRAGDRAILRPSDDDTAAIVFVKEQGLFPDQPLPLLPEAQAARIGFDIGWVGFPNVAPNNLCFFLGRVSSRLRSERSYLVDGVAINGVSGGPAFAPDGDKSLTILGIVSAYLPNMHPRGALPGLCVVRHVGALHDIVREMKSLEQAKEVEAETPPPPTIPERADEEPPRDK